MSKSSRGGEIIPTQILQRPTLALLVRASRVAPIPPRCLYPEFRSFLQSDQAGLDYTRIIMHFQQLSVALATLPALISGLPVTNPDAPAEAPAPAVGKRKYSWRVRRGGKEGCAPVLISSLQEGEQQPSLATYRSWTVLDKDKTTASSSQSVDWIAKRSSAGI